MKPISILYVEDKEDLREVIALMIEGEHTEVVACANGEQALAAFEARAFDVLMTDVSLPGISGTDLARHLLASHPSLWVVLCSGYEFGPELTRLGPNVRSLTKPFEFEDLEALLSEIALSLRRAEV